MHKSSGIEEDSVRRILSLIDMANDAQRNRNDCIHIEKNVIFHYVFDENIFESFVIPTEHTQAHSGFYSRTWYSRNEVSNNSELHNTKRSDKYNSRHLPNFESQTAAITAEWLTSNGLKGLGCENIFMTTLHQEELAIRSDKIFSALKDRAERDNKKKDSDIIHRDLFVEAVNLNNYSSWLSRTNFERNLKADYIENDIALLKSISASDASLSQMRLAYNIALSVEKENIVDSLLQIARLCSREISGKIRSVEQSFGLKDKDLDSVSRDAGNWYKRIMEELSRPGNGERRRARKQDEFRGVVNKKAVDRSIWNDAWSVALIQYVSENLLNPQERIVFVTTDQIICDTYRRWYYNENDPKLNLDDDHYILRRFSQYWPQFNPNDFGGLLSEKVELPSSDNKIFASTQLAVEISSIPLLIADINGLEFNEIKYCPEILSLLISDSVDYREILKELKTHMNSEMNDAAFEMDSLGDKWRDLQRYAIASSLPVLANRVVQGNVSFLAATGEQVDVELGAYIQSLLDAIASSSMNIFMPGAHAVISRLKNSQLAQRRHVVAVDFDYEDSLGGSGDADISPILGKASCLLIEYGEVASGLRYSDLAMRASNGTLRLLSCHYEAMFLDAVAHRYSIAANFGGLLGRKNATPRSLRKVQRAIYDIKTNRDKAKHSLFESRRYHGNGISGAFENSLDRYYHDVRLFRSYSEEAALELFYATSLLVSPIIRMKVFEHMKIKDEAVFSLNKCSDMLKQCLLDMNDGNYDTECVGRDIDVDIRERVKMQVMMNTVAEAVMTFIVTGLKRSFFRMTAKELLSAAIAASTRYSVDHAVWRIERQAFVKIYELDSCNEFDISKLDSSGNMSIPLDEMLFNFIKVRLFRNT